jgi:ribosomal protein S27E
VDTEIIIEFSESMDCESVESAITISPYTEYSCIWSNDNKTLTLTFSEPLEYEILYQISISTQASDMADKDLEDKFELEFTTEQKPADKKGEGIPLMYLLLSLIMAIIAALLIVFMVLAKKRKTSSEMVEPVVESPVPMQVTCSSCNNLLSVNDIGTTMNVSCPYCSTVLTIQSQKAPAQKPEPQIQTQLAPQPEIQPQQSMMQISCPKCFHKFQVVKSQGPIKVQCPNCGVSGTLG